MPYITCHKLSFGDLNDIFHISLSLFLSLSLSLSLSLAFSLSLSFLIFHFLYVSPLLQDSNDIFIFLPENCRFLSFLLQSICLYIFISIFLSEIITLIFLNKENAIYVFTYINIYVYQEYFIYIYIYIDRKRASYQEKTDNR